MESNLARHLLNIPTFLDRADFLLAMMSIKPPRLIPANQCILMQTLASLPVPPENLGLSENHKLQRIVHQFLQKQKAQVQLCPVIIFKPASGIANVLKHSPGLTAEGTRRLVLYHTAYTASPKDPTVAKLIAKGDLQALAHLESLGT
ncbi:hypothetical protein HDU80_001702 [Chytriomyces hyalinus]|nr:hypothetical protein HDU80_001702 [Chytriomyces hyalinus]